MDKKQLHTDLALERVTSLIEGTHYQKTIQHLNNTTIEIYDVKQNKYLPQGRYLEIQFKETSSLKQTLKHYLKQFINQYNYPHILIIGLGNNNFTCDSLGPKTVSKINPTHYLDDSYKLNHHLYDISLFTPGVKAQTGLETYDIIKSIVDKLEIDLVVCIDALCALDYQKLGHVIQMNNAGIHPGSGVSNHTKPINQQTLNIPVITIGIPTVIHTSSMFVDLFSMIKSYFHESLDLGSMLKIGKREKYKGTLTYNQSKQILGEIGILNEEDLNDLLEEILNPVDCNYIMCDKAIDETIDNLSKIISEAINELRYK